MQLMHYMLVCGAQSIVTKGMHCQVTTTCVLLLMYMCRWDMSVTMEECRRNERSLETLKDCCALTDKPNRLGCIHPPLFDISLDHIVIDELHLWLRITDRLIKNLVLRMAQLDHKERTHHSVKQPGHMEKLITSIRSFGVHFDVRNAALNCTLCTVIVAVPNYDNFIPITYGRSGRSGKERERPLISLSSLQSMADRGY